MSADLIWIVGTLVCGFFVGRHLEQKHYKSIRQREKAIGHIPVLTIKTIRTNNVEVTQLATGSHVKIRGAACSYLAASIQRNFHRIS
jgi:hypothetical protein